MNEGGLVAYCGDDQMIGVGTLGRVLSSAGSYQHVMWTQGSRKDEVDLVPTEDIVPAQKQAPRVAASVADQFSDSISDPGMVAIAVRETYEEHGEEGLVAALAEAGHLATYTGYAHEAIATVAARLREDPTFAHVLAQLDDFEAQSLLSRVAVSLLKEED